MSRGVPGPEQLCPTLKTCPRNFISALTCTVQTMLDYSKSDSYQPRLSSLIMRARRADENKPFCNKLKRMATSILDRDIMEKLVGQALAQNDALQAKVDELQASLTRLENRMELKEDKLAAAEERLGVLMDQKFTAMQSQIAQLVANAEAKVSRAESRADELIAASERRVAATEELIATKLAAAEVAIKARAESSEARIADAEKLVERRLAASEREIAELQKETAAARQMAVQSQSKALREVPDALAVLLQRTATLGPVGGMSGQDARAAGYSCKQAKDAGIFAKCSDAREAGYSLKDIKAAGFVQGLRLAGYTIHEMKDAGFTPCECNTAGFDYINHARLVNFQAGEHRWLTSEFWEGSG